MTPREVAQQALELIRSRDNWTTGEYARCHRGGPAVPSTSPNATCWCAEGAIAKVAGTDPERHDDTHAGYRLYRETMKFVRDNGTTPGKTISLADVNDMEGHGAIVSVFERALATA